MEKSNQIFTTGIWNVKKGKEKEFITAWTEIAEWTSENVYNGQPRLMQDTENPSRFISIGQWSNVEDIQKWRKTDEFQKAISKITDLLVEPSQPQTMKVVVNIGEKVSYASVSA